MNKEEYRLEIEETGRLVINLILDQFKKKKNGQKRKKMAKKKRNFSNMASGRFNLWVHEDDQQDLIINSEVLPDVREGDLLQISQPGSRFPVLKVPSLAKSSSNQRSQISVSKFDFLFLFFSFFFP